MRTNRRTHRIATQKPAHSLIATLFAGFPHFRRRRCVGWILPGLLLALPIAAEARYIYTTNGDGSITIDKYTGSGGALTIPDTINGRPVTSVGDLAFADCSLTSLTIPDSVIELGGQAFDGCSDMTSVTIGNSVTNIGNYAFSGCFGLTSVTIPNSVSSIGVGAFTGCRLTSVTIGSGLAEIGSGFNVFAGAGAFPTYSLTNFMVDPLNKAYSSPNGLLFDKSQHTLIAYPGGRAGAYAVPNRVTAIAPAAFLGSKLTSVTIGKSVTNIGNYAFSWCDGLTSVTIPSSVTSIGDNAFYNCSSLTSVTIPDSVTSIGYRGFSDCTSLASLTILSGVVSIGEGAFADCTSLTSVTIPDTVTELGQQAFEGCNGLTSVTIGSGVTDIGDAAFFDTRLRMVFFFGNAPRFGANAFMGFAILYYLPGTTGWSSMFSRHAAVLWNPRIQVGDGSFGVRANGFGFNIAGTKDVPLVVEASTSLATSTWVALQTFTLTNGLVSFTDTEWTNYPSRFYRLRSP